MVCARTIGSELPAYFNLLEKSWFKLLPFPPLLRFGSTLLPLTLEAATTQKCSPTMADWTTNTVKSEERKLCGKQSRWPWAALPSCWLYRQMLNTDYRCNNSGILSNRTGRGQLIYNSTYRVQLLGHIPGLDSRRLLIWFILSFI
jgi:hypothetical protein